MLVTGGSEGIGRSMVDRFAKYDPEENFILTCSRHGINPSGSSERVRSVTMDLADPTATQTLIEQAIHEEVDTLVLNAAVTGIAQVDEQNFSPDYVARVNVGASLQMIDALLPTLRAHDGLVLFLTTPMVRSAHPPAEAQTYIETKRRVEERLRKYAIDPQNAGVTFLAISPGSVATRLHRNIREHMDPFSPLRERTEQLIREDRLRDPEIVGKILYFIADAHAAFNPATKKYDQPLQSGSTYDITDEEYQNAAAPQT